MAKAKPKLKGAWPAATAEIWRPIPDVEYYEASNHGRVRSLDRRLEFVGRWGPTTRLHKGRILTLKRKPNGCGGIYLAFYADGGRYLQVNRVVCHAFNGEPPTPKHEAAHLDGDTENNRPENLAWATALENVAHKSHHGTNPVGSKNGSAKLTEADIRPIFEAYCGGQTTKQIGLRYKTADHTINRVVSGRAWSHVDVGALRATAKVIAQRNLERTWIAAAQRMSVRGHSLMEQS